MKNLAGTILESGNRTMALPDKKKRLRALTTLYNYITETFTQLTSQCSSYRIPFSITATPKQHYGVYPHPTQALFQYRDFLGKIVLVLVIGFQCSLCLHLTHLYSGHLRHRNLID